MDIEKQTAKVWTTYGAHQLTVRPDLPEIERWDWGVADTGPGIESLGDVAGLRILDLGSGVGRHAARLAALGADVTGVDASPTQHERAVTRYPTAPGLRFVCADAVDHLRDATPYNLIYSVNGLPFLDPSRLLPVLGNALKPGGRLLFSALHTTSAGAGPSTAATPRPELLRLPGTDQTHPVHMWVLTTQLWEDLLVEHGLTLEKATAIDAPQPDNQASYRLYEARRPQRVASRQRTSTPPPPNAFVGVGVIVQGPDGVLLGQHRRGTFELPGASPLSGRLLSGSGRCCGASR
ncbi:bifunctional class I SAM-dependent methyltransferase/NUDIX hydrolase [Streptomyces sp. NBC_01244]|uniref:bifunctional class I SAM-dependent methyltransferase/NUDIX hydrolase n=1 Tax=Streptomyces sp. NBC_01244 TaxID=2903797 RepID=UPI002E12F9AC|nr:class I SAM-dependent methyltransferase [Streptomyces sp. NBC_01244]